MPQLPAGKAAPWLSHQVTLPLLVGARPRTTGLAGRVSASGGQSFGVALGALYGWNTVGAVAVDANGESVHETGPKTWQAKIGKIPVAVA